jgi:hypothetical protein
MTRSDSGTDARRTDLLRWSAGLGAVTAEALAVREATSLASARGRLASAERQRLLARWAPLAGRPALYTLTRAGLRAAGLHGIEPARVSAANAEHSIICASVAAALGRSHPAGRVIGEPELRALQRRGSTVVPSAVLGRDRLGLPVAHRADLALMPASSAGAQPILIEVELSVKAPGRLLEICRAWARCRGIAGVIYLVAPIVEAPLQRAIDGAQASAVVTAVPLAQLLAR